MPAVRAAGVSRGSTWTRFDAAMATLLRSVNRRHEHAAPSCGSRAPAASQNGSIAGILAGFSSSMVYGAAKGGGDPSDQIARPMELGESHIARQLDLGRRDRAGISARRWACR